MTLTRIRAILQLATTATAAAEIVVDFGIVVVTVQAFAAGVTAVPDPEDDDADFLWFHSVNVIKGHFREVSAGGFRQMPITIEVDNLAQRKIDGSEKRLVLTAKNRSGTAAEFSFGGRALWLLH